MHRTLAFTIPESISAHVSDIYPIGTFGTYRNFIHIADPETTERADVYDYGMDKRAVPSSCSTSSTTSACYRALYGYDTYSPVATSTNPIVGMYDILSFFSFSH